MCVSHETILSCLCPNIESLVPLAAIALVDDEDRGDVERTVQGTREASDLLVEKLYKMMISSWGKG